MIQGTRLCSTVLSLLLLSGAAAASAFSVSSGEFLASSGQHEPRPTNHELRQPDVRELVPGVPIERELAGGEVHAYRITLDSGQYLRVVVDQRGIDVVVTLFGPDGQQLAEVDSPTGTQGPEPVLVVAEASGIYRLEVRSLEKEAAPGCYEVRIEELRDATPQDQSRVAAERAFAEGEQLLGQGTAESLRRAIEKYEAALRLFRAVGDRYREARTLNSIAGIYADLGEPQQALEYYHQALPLRRAVEDRSGEAATLNNIGLIYDRLGEMQKALEYYSQALALQRAVGDRYGEASMLNNIGLAYIKLGESEKAFEYFNQALPLLRAVGDRRGEAYILVNIGAIYNRRGEMQKALEYYGQALPLLRAAGDRHGEAGALNNIGLIYDDLSQHQQALAYFNQVLPLVRAMGDRYGEAYTLHNISAVYDHLGEYQQALDSYGQALRLRRAVGDRHGEADTLHSMSGVYFRLGEYQQALAYYHQTLDIVRVVGDRRGEAYTLTSVGQVYGELGESQKAMDYHGQALQLSRAVGDRRVEAATLQNMGKVYGELGERQKALDFLSQALALCQAVGDRRVEAVTRYLIAQVERDHGNFVEARPQMEAALAIIESVRTKVTSPELRASYFASYQNYYQFYTDLLMRQHQRHPSTGHDATALQASERARARSLLEILTEARADIRQGIDPALLERERSLQQQLNAKEQYRIKLLSGKHTEEQAAGAEKELRDLLTQYQEVQAQIRTTSPRYAELMQPQPLSLKEIQQQVLDEDTMLLEYALGEERSYLWAVTPTSIASFELPKRAEIEETAKHVYQLLTAPNDSVKGETDPQKMTRIARAEAEYPNAAAGLSQMLLGPVAAQLGNKRLLIVSDGALQYIPFAALPVPDSRPKTQDPRPTTSDQRPATSDQRPLIADHEIVHLPSASVLAVLRKELAGRKPAPKAVAVLADPVFQGNDPRVKRGTSQADKQTGKDSAKPSDAPMLASALDRSIRDAGLTALRRLRFTQQEADGIIALAPAKEGLKALDFAANKRTATSADLSHYRIVHFATHGLLNDQHPELSGVVLSLVDEQGRPQDGFLQLHEVYNLNLPAELVVLSACKTALGKEIKGEGLVGLTRGFMYAGATRVVASLWSVDDQPTAEFMKRFYQEMLAKGQRPAAALRAAQVAMWKKKKPPYDWAAFVLQGEWR